MHILTIADVVPNGTCVSTFIVCSHQNPAFSRV